MKLKDLIFEDSSKIYSALDAAIPEDTNIHSFAKAVAHFLKEEYGSHNVQPFLDTLNKELGLDENINESTKSLSLEELTWGVLTSVLGKVPMFGFHLPHPDDSYRMANNQEAFEDWKKGTIAKYGNINVKLDSEAARPTDKVQVLDDKFIADKKRRVASKGAWLDKEREAGRSID